MVEVSTTGPDSRRLSSVRTLRVLFNASEISGREGGAVVLRGKAKAKVVTTVPTRPTLARRLWLRR